MVHSDDTDTARQRLNSFLAHRALDTGKGVAHHMPVEVYVQVASACNLDCYMCSEHLRPPGKRHGRDVEALPLELWDRIVAEVFPYSSRVNIGLGGEPMISPHFLHYIETAHAAGQEVSLVTNGTRINRDAVAETLARCVSFMQISLDGATRETYERIRLGSHWGKIRANLEMLNRYRMAHPPERRTHVTFCFVLMKSNVHELAEFVRFAREFHADRVHAQHVIPVTEEGKHESLFDEQERYDRYLAEAEQVGRELGMELSLPRAYGTPAGASSVEPAMHPPAGAPAAPLAPARIPCHMPTMTVFLFYDGRVYPCCHPFAHQKMQLGDLRTQSFSEIWRSTMYRNLRAGLFRGDAPSICRGCSIVHSPPPQYEDPDALNGGESKDLAGYYDGRDLDPLVAGDRDMEFVEKLVELGLSDQFDHLRATAAAHQRKSEKLEHILRISGVMTAYRIACAVKDRVLRRRTA
jgi:radical SAM protein with 4Fe4S-binding SPASM domain